MVILALLVLFAFTSDIAVANKPPPCGPDGTKCGANQTYVTCKTKCPDQYCPKDDGPVAVCDAPNPCPSGCACNASYLMLCPKDERCILATDCPPIKCTRPNEVYDPQPLNCVTERCTDLGKYPVCDGPIIYRRPACVCKPGYYRDANGVCISGSDCLHCNKKNATFSECPSVCPLTCANQNNTGIVCPAVCGPAGCVCKKGYVLNKDGGSCILRKDCPENKPVCPDPNAEWTECTSACPPTCADRFLEKPCILICKPPSCQCKRGYVLNNKGKCVLPKDCPTCKGDYNATMSDCPTPCPATCDDPSTNQICTKNCLEPGCVCKPGFVFNKATRKCIIASDCPGSEFGCAARNATYKECRSACPLSCPKPGPQVSIKVACPTVCKEPGCECKSGYVLDSEGNCILSKDCPDYRHVCPDPNAVWTECSSACPPTCAERFVEKPCILICKPPSCQCKIGYILNHKGKCVLPKDCPTCKGDYNATISDCPTPCPATCDDPRTNQTCIKKCLEPGCVCKPDFVFNKATGKCIIAEDCPGSECRARNATYKECRSSCPARCPKPGSSVKDTSLILCADVCREPGCECDPGYVLDQNDNCVLPKDCPGKSHVCPDPNASWTECTSACPPTCAERFVERACILMCMEPGCQCNSGYYLNDKGVCVLPADCPTCKGNYNATMTKCPTPCPATCAEPESNKVCNKMCLESGCVCKSGFIRSECGKCIVPGDCPGGAPCCPANETYAQCKIGCPTNNCPTSDIRAVPACSMPNPCPSGCVCKAGNLRREDGRCVLSSDCPPVKCTRQNEEWDPNPPNCLADRCEDRLGNSTECSIYWPQGRPACVCKKGFCRNEKGICVPTSECPQACKVPKECRRTCTSPNPPNCPYNPPENNIDGCDCKDGYILSDKGICIKIEECPNDQPCNNDPNARCKRCPLPCPSTCSSPDATPCKKACEPIGCECKEGYIFNKEGKCVLPEQCPGGNPCGPNGIFSTCRHGCPQDFCPEDDSREIILCKPPRDCLPGCRCKINHKWLSNDNRVCVESSKCPPVNCTRQYEEWNCCPSDCLAEMCEDANKKPPICNTLVLNCQPKCVCKKDHFRNKNDLCVPACDCP